MSEDFALYQSILPEPDSTPVEMRRLIRAVRDLGVMPVPFVTNAAGEVIDPPPEFLPTGIVMLNADLRARQSYTTASSDEVKLDAEALKRMGKQLEKLLQHQVLGPNFDTIYGEGVWVVPKGKIMVVGTVEHHAIIRAWKAKEDGSYHVWTTSGQEDDFPAGTPCVIVDDPLQKPLGQRVTFERSR